MSALMKISSYFQYISTPICSPLSLIYKTLTFRLNAASLHGSAQPPATSFNRFKHLSGVLSSSFIGLSFQQNIVWNINVSGLEASGRPWMEMKYMVFLLGLDGE